MKYKYLLLLIITLFSNYAKSTELVYHPIDSESFRSIYSMQIEESKYNRETFKFLFGLEMLPSQDEVSLAIGNNLLGKLQSLDSNLDSFNLTYVIWQDQQIVGYIQLKKDVDAEALSLLSPWTGVGNVAEVSFYVFPDSRGRGIAQEAVTWVQNSLAPQFGVKFILSVNSWNNIASERLIKGKLNALTIATIEADGDYAKANVHLLLSSLAQTF